MDRSLDTARKLIGEYGAGRSLNPDAYQRFLRLCEFADELSDEFMAESIDIQVSPEESGGKISVFADELVFEHGRSHPFFEQIKNADFLSFSKANGGILQVSFGVRNLWVKK